MPHAMPPRTVAARAPVLMVATADLCLCRRHSNSQWQMWLSLLWSLWVLRHTRVCLSPPSLRQVWGLILNVILPFLPSFWGFFFALGHGYLFWWDPTFSSQWLFSCELQFWSSCRRRWVHILLLCHLEIILQALVCKGEGTSWSQDCQEKYQ